MPVLLLWFCTASSTLKESVCPSVIVAVSQSDLSGAYIPLGPILTGSYYTYGVPLGKGCAVTLNIVSRSRSMVMIIFELTTEKSLSKSYILSPWFNLAHTSLKNAFGQRMRSDLE